jgi:Domain of Unknown Function with PDB structure (DUF3857)/Transglutaminase-like superfamily
MTLKRQDLRGGPLRRVAAMGGLRLGLAVVACGGARELSAQTMLPAAPSDSIIRLAVDPAKHRGRPYVMLLDESHNRIERDGRSVRRTRQVYQVLDQQVVRAFSERAFSYARSHQSLRVDWIRVLNPGGEVLSDKAGQEQESDVTAQLSNPIYQEQRVRRVSLSGVAVGTILDVQFTVEERAPYRAGDFLLGWSVNNQLPIIRSRFAVDVPDGFVPRIVERNLNFRRTESVQGGRRTYTWAANDVVPYRGEAFAADSNTVMMSIAVTSPSTWNEVASWYDGLSRDRYVLAAPVAARIDSIVTRSRARTRQDTIRAVHRWVAQDIRYVSVSLGIGGYQPRTPADVLTSGFGDCKDKATLFVAALRRYGIASSPVLLSLGGKPDPALPSIYQFNHAIAAVQDGAGWTFTDLTAEFIPYGAIPDQYRGQLGIVVLPDGRAQEIRFPVVPVDANGSTMRIHLTLDTSGRGVARVAELARGNTGNGMRAAFGVPLDSARRASTHKAVAQRLFSTDATGDSLVAFDGRDLAAPVTITYVVTAENVLKPVGDMRLLSMNVGLRGPARAFRNLARELEARTERVFPIDASQVLGQLETITDLRITLPAGWKAELPKNVSATAFFGRYESTWSQEGREVRMVRRIHGDRGIFPPQRITEVIAWLKTVGADDIEFLSLRAAPVP